MPNSLGARFILGMISLFACLFPSLLTAGPRPNIVFLFSDDHSTAAVSAYGEQRQLLQTPNIDRIAKAGMRFDRCLVPNSICGPSRACILTGQYNHINGFYNNSNCVFDGAGHVSEAVAICGIPDRHDWQMAPRQ